MERWAELNNGKKPKPQFLSEKCDICLKQSTWVPGLPVLSFDCMLRMKRSLRTRALTVLPDNGKEPHWESQLLPGPVIGR